MQTAPLAEQHLPRLGKTARVSGVRTSKTEDCLLHGNCSAEAKKPRSSTAKMLGLCKCSLENQPRDGACMQTHWTPEGSVRDELRKVMACKTVELAGRAGSYTDTEGTCTVCCCFSSKTREALRSAPYGRFT